MPSPSEWFFAPFHLNIKRGLLSRDSEIISLRPKTFLVLCYLVENHGKLIDKNQLLDAVWGRRHISESVLEGCISELRKALGDQVKAPRYLETVVRRGYRFVANVQPATPADAPIMLPGLARQDTPYRVERKAAMERLLALWAQAQHGQARLLFVTGEAGIGKTTLIEMFIETVAAQEPALLWGQCIEHFGCGEAFLPLLTALQQVGSGLVPLLRARAPTWLVQMPGLCEPALRIEMNHEVLGATRERMLREGCELLEALSLEKPLIVVLEDLHWADFATLDLLAALGRRRSQASLLVIGTYRPGDVPAANHPLRLMHRELQIHHLCAELTLDVFAREELNAYLMRRFSDARFPEDVASLIYLRSGGHPLLVVNLLDHLLREGKIRQNGQLWSIEGNGKSLDCSLPDNIRTMIELRLARLNAEEQALLGIMSVAGMEASAVLLATILEEDPITVERLCENLIRHGPMLVAAGFAEWPDGSMAGNYAFRHGLYAEVLYQGLPVSYRISLHRRLGERLEKAYGQQCATVAAELARHFEEGCEPVKAVQYLRLAAQQSAGRFSNREALAYLCRCLALVERLPESQRDAQRFPLLHWSAAVRCSMYNMQEAIADLMNLLNLARAARDKAWEVKALVDLSRMYFLVHPKRCIEWVDEALLQSHALDDEQEKTLVKGYHGHWYLGYVEWRDEYAQACVDAVEAAYATQDSRIISGHLVGRIVCELFRSDYRTACASSTEGMCNALQAGDGYLYMVCQSLQLMSLLLLGEWGQLRAMIDDGIEIAKRNGNLMQMRRFHKFTGLLHVEAGDYEYARELGETLVTMIVPGDSLVANLCQILLAKACIAMGDYPRARLCLREVARRVEQDGMMISGASSVWILWTTAEYWLALKKPRMARKHVDELYAIADKRSERTFLAIAHQLNARIALSEANLGEAEMHLSKALAIVECSEVPLAVWRVHETASKLYAKLGAVDRAHAFRDKSRNQLMQLANTLDEADPLRARLYARVAGVALAFLCQFCVKASAMAVLLTDQITP